MGKIKYTDGKPITPSPTQVWEVTFKDNGDRIIMVLDKSFNTEGVIRLVDTNNFNREFDVQNITVGVFVIKECRSSYSSDARKVDHNLYFV